MTTPREAKVPTRVKVGHAKGRPMLSWVGKHPLRELPVFPAQEAERFSLDGRTASAVDWSAWPAKYPQGGLLFHGDNKEVLAHLVANGFRAKVDLVYIDPPFDSGADYVRRVSLRGPKGTAKLDGEGYTIGEQIQYTDIWANDTYLQFMYERLLLLKELLAPRGVLYLHLDWRRVAPLRLVLDEIFGSSAFRNEIVWLYKGKGLTGDKGKFPAFHASILAYANGDDVYFEPQREEGIAASVLERWGRYLREDGTINVRRLTGRQRIGGAREGGAPFPDGVRTHSRAGRCRRGIRRWGAKTGRLDRHSRRSSERPLPRVARLSNGEAGRSRGTHHPVIVPSRRPGTRRVSRIRDNGRGRAETGPSMDRR